MPLPAPVTMATLFSSLSFPMPTSASLEKPLPFPARDDLVELALLGPQEVEVVLDDVLAERLLREAARLEQTDRFAQASRYPRQLPGRVDVAPEGRRRLDAPRDSGEP